MYKNEAARIKPNNLRIKDTLPVANFYGFCQLKSV